MSCERMVKSCELMMLVSRVISSSPVGNGGIWAPQTGVGETLE